jgi:hypothetical protein
LQEEKAYFSKVGVPSQHDYPLVFKDYQNVQRLRKKLLKTLGFLEANLNVSNKYNLTAFAECDSSAGTLSWYNSQLDISQRGVCHLLKNAEAVGETVSDFFSSCNSELPS